MAHFSFAFWLTFQLQNTRVVWDERNRGNIIDFYKNINLYECPLTTPPPEIVKQGNASILSYFEELERQGVDSLYEAKMLVIGEGGAGKTSLVRKLQDEQATLPTEEESTHGIDIQDLEFPLDNGRNFQVNLWDFGGQEIYHATHQFFLTKRSLYVLVDDTRKDDKHVNDPIFSYWFQTVKLLGGGSPLLIVQNEKGDRSKQLDLPSMQARFDFIKDVYPTNLKTGRGLETVKEAIKYHIQQLPHVGQKLPAQWVAIREALEEIAQAEPFINLRRYYALCAQHDMPERERANNLSRFLHDLGVFLHFQDDPLLRRTLFLQNEWITDAVYHILDAEPIKKKFGRILLRDLEAAWSQPTYQDMHAELIALMKKFELCYELEANREYLIPQLLKVSRPKQDSWQQDAPQLQLRYRYGFMPKGLLSRIMVRLHRYIPHPDQAWKTGVIMERKNAQALLLESWSKSSDISIKVQGEDCKEFLTLISEEFDSLHATFEGIEVEKLIPCNCRVCKEGKEEGTPSFYAYDDLDRRLKRGKSTIECPISYADVDVRGLIDAVFVDLQDIRQEVKKDFCKVFISYSKKDKHYLDALKVMLEPLDYIHFDDRNLIPGEEWDERIQQELQSADIILMLVSADFLATKYIKEVEIQQALNRHEKGEAKVIPIILRRCLWEKTVLSKLSALPEKGKPITKWDDNDEAWTEVAMGIERAVEELKNTF